MVVNYLSCFLFCPCVTYAGAETVATVGQKSSFNDSKPIMKNNNSIFTAIDRLHCARLKGAVDLFSRDFNLAEMSR